MSARQIRGFLLVLLGLTLVFTALWLHKTQEQQDIQAGENAQVLLTRLQTPAATVTIPRQTPTAMAEKEYRGYRMIGTLRIGELQLELPILSTWSEELLQVAPCRYSGTLQGKDLILMGHNYKSHFTPLHHIAEGAKVEFEDVNGISHHYQVEKIEILRGSDIEKLPSEYPLTLFTCTAGGQNRIVIRCAEV